VGPRRTLNDDVGAGLRELTAVDVDGTRGAAGGHRVEHVDGRFAALLDRDRADALDEGGEDGCMIFAFSPAARRAARGKKIRTTRVRMCAPYGQTPFPVGIFSGAFSRMTIAYVVRLSEASKLKKEFLE